MAESPQSSYKCRTERISHNLFAHQVYFLDTQVPLPSTQKKAVDWLLRHQDFCYFSACLDKYREGRPGLINSSLVNLMRSEALHLCHITNQNPLYGKMGIPHSLKKETLKLKIGHLLCIQLPPWQPLCGHCAAWESGLFFPSQNRKSIVDLT